MKTVKVIIVRHHLPEGDYAEARQFFSDAEIREMLREEGLNGFRNKVAACVGACKTETSGCFHGGHQ